MNLRRSLPLLCLTGLAGALAGILAAHMLSQKRVALQGGTWLPQPRELAPFRLTDLRGGPFDNRSLLGHASLVFFGYSSCPDVCPATLATIQAVLRHAPIAGLQVLFVTIDPERDSPPRPSRNFAPSVPPLLPLTGRPAALGSWEKTRAAPPR